jgi:sugar-specific transcriptional regulator TrmB
MQRSFGSKQETIELLLQLGLSSTQARVYFALSQLGTSETRLLSNCSRVARPDIYRVIEDLIDLGLVSKSIERPLRFTAIPIKDGLSILLNRKKEANTQLELDIAKLLEKLRGCDPKKVYLHPMCHFEFIPAKEFHIKILEKLLECVQLTSVGIGPLVPVKSSFLFEDLLIKKAVARGVKIQIIIGDTTKSEEVRFFSKRWSKCDFRFLPAHPKIAMSVYDSKCALIREHTKNGSFEAANAIVTDNESIVGALEDYFKLLWERALDAQAFKRLEHLQELNKLPDTCSIVTNQTKRPAKFGEKND